MGNAQQVENLKSYKMASANLVKGSQEGNDEGAQFDLYSPAHDSYFTNLVTQTAEEKQVFRGPVVEDIVEKPIMSTLSKKTMNRNWNISTKPLLKQRPSEVEGSVPKISSPSISISPPSLDNRQIQKPWKSEIPATEVSDECKEDDPDGKNKVTGHLIIKETADILSPVLEFSSGRFPNKRPIRMVSTRTQLTVFPTIFSDGNHVAYQEQMGDQETIRANQTFKAADTNVISQGGSLAIGNSTALEALPNTMQPLNSVLIPIASSQNTKQMAKSHQLFTPISSALESIGEYTSSELLINTPSIEDRQAEQITQETAATDRTNMVNPVEDESRSIPPLPPCNLQTKTQENTQVKSIMCFSYADALKKRLEVSQPKGAPKPPGKDEQGLTIHPKFGGHQNLTRVKVTTAKAKFLSNRSQNSVPGNSKNHETLNSNKITQIWNVTRPVTPPFNFTKAQPRFEWTSPCYNPKDHFQFKGSWNTTKPRAFTPNDSIQFCKINVGRNKVQRTTNFGSSWAVPKKNSTGMQEEEAKPKEYKSYPIARRSTAKLACNFSPKCTFKEPAKNKAVVSVQLQDVGLQTPESTLPKKAPRANLSAATLKPHVQAEKSEQISKCETPVQVPEVKLDVPQPMLQSEITGDTETSAEEHGDTSNLSNSCSSVPHMKKTTESNDQIPNPSLVIRETKTTSELTTHLEVPDNEGVNNNDPVPDVAPKCHPSGRWKAFYVDKTCTMKCRSKHNPGKLPPNVVRWLSVLENKQPESEWITTLKVMSSLVAGTKFAMDHHSSYVLETSSTKSKKRH